MNLGLILLRKYLPFEKSKKVTFYTSTLPPLKWPPGPHELWYFLKDVNLFFRRHRAWGSRRVGWTAGWRLRSSVYWGWCPLRRSAYFRLPVFLCAERLILCSSICRLLHHGSPPAAQLPVLLLRAAMCTQCWYSSSSSSSSSSNITVLLGRSFREQA